MSTATAPCLTVADFLDDVARIMVDEHGHDTVTVYDDYLTFEGYILDVEFWGHPSVPTPAPRHVECQARGRRRARARVQG